MSMATKQKQESGFAETVRVIFHALVIALIIRTFLFQPFNIPSGSMKNTLLVGDYLFVSKFSYGYSRFSLPFSPNLFSGRIWDGTPARGDIAVFKLPKDNSTDYIKRVIGLPGDRIQMLSCVLHSNGEPGTRARPPAFRCHDPQFGNQPIRRWHETLPNGVSYEPLDLVDHGFSANTPVYEVSAGHY